jgi:hypothetical protein
MLGYGGFVYSCIARVFKVSNRACIHLELLRMTTGM